MKGLFYVISLLMVISFSCTPKQQDKTQMPESYIKVLGVMQDAGMPHMGCQKQCCEKAFAEGTKREVVSLAFVDTHNEKLILFEATPDIHRQLDDLTRTVTFLKKNKQKVPDAFFLTHAHIGHYAGLMYLGKEAMNAQKVPVYCMPRMKTFLENNGPWSQLVSDSNIVLIEMKNNAKVFPTKNISMMPFLVPHRDEYSETVGYRLFGENKTALFIPDIDKWGKWDESIVDNVKGVDYAFLDATFYSGKELNNRDISEIPHPFIIESMQLFDPLPSEQKAKINFIHFNHTNPVLNKKSEAYKEVIGNGYRIAWKGQVLEM